MMAVRRIRAERSPNRAARLRQEHNTRLARMPPDTMRTGLARAAGRGIQACGQAVAHFFGTDHARRRGTRAPKTRNICPSVRIPPFRSQLATLRRSPPPKRRTAYSWRAEVTSSAGSSARRRVGPKRLSSPRMMVGFGPKGVARRPFVLLANPHRPDYRVAGAYQTPKLRSTRIGDTCPSASRTLLACSERWKLTCK